MTLIAKKQNGFTVIELIIVIVVVGLLAAIVISTYSGIRVKERNSTRQRDIQVLQTRLEAFYSQNGYYPSLQDINSTSWRTKNMPNLNPSDMIDPSASIANVSNAKLASKPGPGVFSYQVTDSNGNSCETKDTNCAKYTLTATFEGTVDGRKSYVKQNF